MLLAQPQALLDQFVRALRRCGCPHDRGIGVLVCVCSTSTARTHSRPDAANNPSEDAAPLVFVTHLVYYSMYLSRLATCEDSRCFVTNKLTLGSLRAVAALNIARRIGCLALPVISREHYITKVDRSVDLVQQSGQLEERIRFEQIQTH